MKPNSVAVVGAAETTQMGRIPDMSVTMLHADAALNAMKDAGLKPSDIDGVACAGESPTNLAYYLGITPKYLDGTSQRLFLRGLSLPSGSALTDLQFARIVSGIEGVLRRAHVAV